MRDLIVVAMVVATLPFIIFRPFFGLLVYSWVSYMRPQDMAWGWSRVMPLSQWIAIAMILGLLFTWGRERLLTLKLPTVLLLLLCGWISLSYMNALVPELGTVAYGHYWKAILISVLTTGIVVTRERLRLMLLLVGFSIGFLGAKRGLFGLLRGGVRFDDGPGGFMNDNNTFALGLNVALPILVGIALTDPDRRVRMVSSAMAFLCTLTILFTFSRGGFLTLCIVGAMLVWRSRHKLLAGGLVAVAIAVFFVVSADSLTEEYVERTQSIASYEEDGSAMGRIHAWQTAWRVFLDYPMFGVGPENMTVVFRSYSPAPDRFRVTHNSYLQMLAECGLPALVLFVAALAVTMLRLSRLRKGATEPWVAVNAHMLQVSLIAYMTGSLFLNMAYFELVYHLIGISVSLGLAAEAAGAVGGVPAAPAAAEELPWWKRPAPTLGRA